MGLHKVNTIGIRQANKCMHLAAIAYNLKKYLKFKTKRVKSGANDLRNGQNAIPSLLKALLLAFQNVLRLLFSCQKVPLEKAGLA